MIIIATILSILIPRIMLIGFWIGGVSSRAFEGFFIPLLGFLFLPRTTMGWIAFKLYAKGSDAGIAWIIAGLVIDFMVITASEGE